MRQAAHHEQEDDRPGPRGRRRDALSRPRPRGGRRRPFVRTALLSSLCVAGLAYLALQGEGAVPDRGLPAVPVSALVAPAPAWAAVPADKIPFVHEAAARTEAREHRDGGRETTLILGDGSGRVVLVQGHGEAARSFYVDLARRAAAAGLSVTRSTQGRSLSTKFGPAEIAAVTLAGGQQEQACRAFRFTDPAARLAFQGWLCGAPVPDEVQVTCLVDGIVLRDATDPALKALFTRAEAARTESCPQAPRRAISLRSPGRP